MAGSTLGHSSRCALRTLPDYLNLTFATLEIKTMMKLNVKLLIGALMLGSVAVESHADCSTNEQGYLNIAGEYFSIISSGNISATNVYIKQAGNAITVNAGNGAVWGGSISGLTVSLPSASLIAGLKNNCNELVWNDGNGSTWVRK